jgi:quercetin dioxygenase-like cupin family protein
MITRSVTTGGRKVAYAVFAAAALLLVAAPYLVRGDIPSGHEKLLLSKSLADVPGKKLTALVVRYAPGGKSPKHRHAGDVFAFVISGAVRSQNSATGPARIYHAGESFYEPAGSVHLVSENASAQEPAQLLAVFVADGGAQLTTTEP